MFRRVYGQDIETGAVNILAIYETMDRMEIPKNDQLDILDQVVMVVNQVKERVQVK